MRQNPHAYVQRRAALAKALQDAVSPTAFKRLILKMYQLAMAGNVQAGMFLITQLAGKAPEHPSPLQMTPAARVARQPGLTLDAISDRLNRLLEDFEAGTIGEGEARTCRDILAAMVTARQTGELEKKYSELLAALEREANGQPS